MPLFLIGFMAAGKTSVGRALAAATGRRFVDLDDAIAATGVSVQELVARDERAFREVEAKTLGTLLTADAVVATGGGAATFGDNLERMRAAGLVVALGVDAGEARRRAAGGPARPLLSNAEALAVERAPIYRRAHAVVSTMGKSIDEVVSHVKHVERVFASLRARDANAGTTIVALGERSYAVVTTAAIDRALVMSQLGSPSKIAVITDRNVARHHAFAADETIVIEPGEASKSFAKYEQLSSELVERGLDRASAIVALGGGVVGDLAGFVASTLYRGIPIVQLPTTLVAMTDAAIGGKTAIDLPAGKNLVGAFWQPRLVACATDTLATLPARERRAGFGELWKYALLDGRALWDAVAACAAWAAGPDGVAPPPRELKQVIDRSIAFKAEIVGRDEREVTGQRALLNLGHTVGHAIESASGMLHGEAVALGLVAACRVSAAVLGTRDLSQEVSAALASSGLPADPSPWFTDEVLAGVKVDKKRIGANLRFIAVREVGACEPIEIAVTDLSRILRPVAGA
ncbi:MAG: 3-dehydroquinate synthase [Myxococcota bacterium]|nr:3-dehydroquinate synthase [Myxococcota bacterium]